MTALAALEKTSSKRGRPRNQNLSGRPPPVDLSRRVASHFSPLPPVSRRSTRRPRCQLREDFYNVDEIVVDDEDDCYFEDREQDTEPDVVVDDDDDDEEEDKRCRSKKKLKLLLKLHTHHHIRTPTPTGSHAPVVKTKTGTRIRSSSSSPGVSSSSDNDGAGDEIRHQDWRRYPGRCSKISVSGTSGTSLPDSKTLILFLDKIQKKDKYGVFAEPVDPKELPDYHEVIEHPMDFGTIRKKLTRNLYANLEQFEGDVFLLCSNAMQYNAPETIYFKQASSMEELARKKFQMIRAQSKVPKVILNDQQYSVAEKHLGNEPTSGVEKSVENQRNLIDKPIENQSNLDADKSMEMSQSSNQAKGSETPPCVGLPSNGCVASDLENRDCGGSEKHDNDCRVGNSNFVLCEVLSEKAQSPLERGTPPSHGYKPSSLDLDRHATYITSNQQSDAQPESLFSTFDCEKQLIGGGPLDETSYARSLARFSATLGPIAWRIASEKIRKALPAGLEFGPGWVGEYEPLLTPIFSCQNYLLQVSGYSKKLWYGTGFIEDKDEVIRAKQDVTTKSVHIDKTSDHQSAHLHNLASVSVKEGFIKEGAAEGKQALFGFTLGPQSLVKSEIFQQHRDNLKEYTKVCNMEKIKTEFTTHGKTMIDSHADVATQQPPNSSELKASRLLDIDSGDWNRATSSSVKEPDASVLETKYSKMRSRGLPQGQDSKNSNDHKLNASFSFISPNDASKVTASIPLGTCHQKIDDPVKIMTLSTKIPIYQNSYFPNEGKQFILPPMSPSKHSHNTLATSAPTWMSIRTSREHNSAEALANSGARIIAPACNRPSWMFPYSVPGFQVVNNSTPVMQLLQTPSQMVVEENVVQKKNSVALPQLLTPDLSRFHGQSPSKDFVPHSQKRQSKSILPPDLNIGFHVPGSPVEQPSAILVDSQPDLALQL